LQYAKSQKQDLSEEDGSCGSVGLRNLGNTCYMNSMLQCLNAAEPLRRFMQVGEEVEKHINTKNALGTGGQLATAYSALVSEMWSGQFKTVAPSEFKETIGQFAPQFAGFNQQDSMELFNYLLDNLHEDLNRVIDKPYTEQVDDEGQSDVELAGEAWRRFKLRNDSIVVDSLMGQFRSHLTCPECKSESRKYDTYSSVALPLPSTTSKQIEVMVITEDFTAPAFEVKVTVSKKGTAKDIVEDICAKLAGRGLTPANLLLVEVLHGKVYKTLYSPRFALKQFDLVEKILDNDIIMAYQVPEQRLHETVATPADALDVDDDDAFGYARIR
jgi:hypothetical protein